MFLPSWESVMNYILMCTKMSIGFYKLCIFIQTTRFKRGLQFKAYFYRNYHFKGFLTYIRVYYEYVKKLQVKNCKNGIVYFDEYFLSEKQENSKKENSRSFKQIRKFSEKKRKVEGVFSFEKTLKNVFIPKIRTFAEYAQTHTLQNSDVFHQSFSIVSF